MSDTEESRQSFILEAAVRSFVLGDCILIGRQTLEDSAGQYMYMYMGSDLTIIAACSNIRSISFNFPCEHFLPSRTTANDLSYPQKTTETSCR